MLGIAIFGLRFSARDLLAICVVAIVATAAMLIASRPSVRSRATRFIGDGTNRLRAARDRIGLNRLRLLGQASLALLFAALSFQRITGFVRALVPVGLDIRIYYRGVEAWLRGANPWDAYVATGTHVKFFYAGSPATTLVLAPGALLSEDHFTVLWLGLTALSAVAILRWLRLPLWWLMFPPIAEALFSGNPQLIILMLLLAGGGPLGAAADTIGVALKVYAIVPLLAERHLRRLGLALAVTIASFLIAPSMWFEYLNQFGTISARLAHGSGNGFSAFYYPLLLVPTAVAIVLLWRRDPKAAAWLAVPALWPATELHYSTLALPVMNPLLAVLLAIPIPRLPPVAIILYVIWRYAAEPVQRRLANWATEATVAADARAEPL